ncbi:MAG TPA: kelch repeat-containing protein [Caulobacteraceae bacterium]
MAVAQPGTRGALAAQQAGAAKESSYVWTRVTSRAVVPAGANFRVFVQGKAYAFHPDRTWSTADGRGWKPEPLPDSKLNTAYLQYVQHDGAVYALGEMTGSYSDFTIDPVVRRTSDFKKWETLGKGNLPKRIFYTVISFKGSIWLIGGDDGQHLYNDVWRSTDGLTWTRVLSNAPWTPRSGAQAFVYKNRLWLIGGADADGLTNDVWFTTDGASWVQVTDHIADEKPFGYTPVIYDNKIWLVGVDGGEGGDGEMMVSEDGALWRPVRAPWSARTGVAAWVMDGALFMAAGALAGEDTVYSREVWRMDH